MNRSDRNIGHDASRASGCVRFICLVLPILFASLASSASADTDSADKAQRNHFGAFAASIQWDEASWLELAPLDYTMQHSGRFKSDGFGLILSYHRRLARFRVPAVMLGCDFAGHSHESQRSAIWTNAVTGAQSTVKLSLIWGYLTGSGRFVWREARMPEIVLGIGAGVYLIKIQEQIEDFGYADTGHDDATLGAFLSAGLHFPIRRTSLDVATEFKWHAFSFDDLGAAFPGQEATGPAYTIEIGVDWRF